MCQASYYLSDYISIRAAADAWTGNGGSNTNIVAAVAVAMAESGLNRFALSPACAIGLWQILDIHAQSYNITVDMLYDIRVNAYIAVQLSQDGTEWGPWDVAYAEGSNLQRRRHIAYPDQGSAAYSFIPAVAAALGSSGGSSGGGGQGTQTELGAPPSVSPPSGLTLQPYPPYPGQSGNPGQAPYPPDITNPVLQYDGWSNLVRFWTDDIPYLTQYDRRLLDSILR